MNTHFHHLQKGIHSLYTFEDRYGGTDTQGEKVQASLLLLVKEAVLDLLGANNHNTFCEHSPAIQEVVNSTDINSIIGVLDRSQQEELLKYFNGDVETNLLKILCLIHNDSKFSEELVKNSLNDRISQENIGSELALRGKYQNAIVLFKSALNFVPLNETHARNNLYSKISMCYLGLYELYQNAHEAMSYLSLAIDYYQKAGLAIKKSWLEGLLMHPQRKMG